MGIEAIHAYTVSREKTDIWMNELKGSLNTGEEETYKTLKAVMQALRDRITVEEAADLAAQLPLLLRGVYYEGWKPSDKPLKMNSLDEFYQYVKTKGLPEDIEAESACKSVMEMLSKRISSGELSDIRDGLPKDLKALIG